MPGLTKELENPFVLGGIIIILFLAFQGIKYELNYHQDVSAQIWQTFMTEPTRTTVFFMVGLLIVLFIIRGNKR